MKRINYDDIKIVVMNPERIPHAKEVLMKYLYEEYIRRGLPEDCKKIAQ